MLFAALTLFVLVCGLEAAPAPPCPKSCACTGTELACSSFKFLQKLTDSHAATLTKMVVNNSTAATNPKLNHLQNLKTLNLASNKIKQINALNIPASVESLDLSNNFITTLPQDFRSVLTGLKEVRLTGNPISCTCDSISIRDQLLQSNVRIATPVKCHSPDGLRGKSWLTVSCVRDLFGEMQGDAPFEGSGFEDGPVDKSLEEEYIRVDSPKLNASKPEEEEGSGASEEEDYNVASEPPMVRVNDLLLNNVKACNFDCSTPAPTENGTDDALSPPGIFEGVQILLDDFNILKVTQTNTTPAPVAPPDVKKTDAEVLTKTDGEEKGSITEETKLSNSSTYIFLGALLVLIIALVVYAVVKKRYMKRRSHSLDPVDERVGAKNEVELLKATNGTHEIVPLMNGTPNEDVELRQKPSVANGEHSSLLEPEPKRVKIKATEIPNSVPKSPFLVTRHVTYDGTVVTTPSIVQKV